jgi:hypothetical protein
MLIAFKLKLALACAAGLAGPLAVAPLVLENGVPGSKLRDPIAVVELDRAAVSYRVRRLHQNGQDRRSATGDGAAQAAARDYEAPGQQRRVSALRR